MYLIGSSVISSASATYFLFFIFILGALTYGFSVLLDKDVQGVSRNSQGEIIYVGSIEQERVEKVMALYQRGDRLLIKSAGGDLYAGIMLGNFIHQQKMSVEVLDFCISSCANYVFLSGYTKILNPNSLVIFHGGPKQANFRSLMQQAYLGSATPGTVFGKEGYEAIISVADVRRQLTMRNNSNAKVCGKNEVLNRRGECEVFGPEQRLQYIIYLEEELYSQVNPNMDKNIPYYGQQGRYEETYLGYEYFGFFYDIESLERLNVSNVSVRTGLWQPQLNPLFRQVYEVTIE